MVRMRLSSSFKRTVAVIVVMSALSHALRKLRSSHVLGDSALVPSQQLPGWRSCSDVLRMKLQRRAVTSSQGAASIAQSEVSEVPAARPAAVPPSAVSLPPVAPAPSAGVMQVAAAAVLTPALLLGLMLLSPFVKDAEAAVVRPMPDWILKILRKVPLTWELFSAWEFAVTVIAAMTVQPRLGQLFLADHGLKQLHYGSRPEQTLLLFEADSHEEKRPLVLFVHGGSWSHSRHWMYRLVGRRLAGRGLSTAVVGYGQYPYSTVQEMVHDVNSAVDWFRQFGSQHRIDTSRMFLLGHSSGGHLCALAALTGGAAGLSGIAALSSPMDIADHYAWEQGRGVADISALYPAHGGELNFASFSPTRLVAQLPEGTAATLLPPFFVGHGTADWTVPPEASERFVAALTGAGAKAEFRRWAGLGHFSILGSLMGFPGAEEADAAAEDLEAFMQRCLMGAEPESVAVAEDPLAVHEVRMDAVAQK